MGYLRQLSQTKIQGLHEFSGGDCLKDLVQILTLAQHTIQSQKGRQRESNE